MPDKIIILINTPLLKKQSSGWITEDFRISTQGLSDKNRYIQSVTLNGAAYPYSAIRHKDIIAGGELILKMGKKPSEWGQQLLLNEENKNDEETYNLSVLLCLGFTGSLLAQSIAPDTLLFVFKLHGQTRKYEMSFREKQDSICLYWGIERNLKWQSGSYTMGPRVHRAGRTAQFPATAKTVARAALSGGKRFTSLSLLRL